MGCKCHYRPGFAPRVLGLGLRSAAEPVCKILGSGELETFQAQLLMGEPE